MYVWLAVFDLSAEWLSEELSEAFTGTLGALAHASTTRTTRFLDYVTKAVLRALCSCILYEDIRPSREHLLNAQDLSS